MYFACLFFFLFFFFFLMIRRPPRSTHCISSAASDVYKRQILSLSTEGVWPHSTIPCDGSSGGIPGYYWDGQKCEVCGDENCYCTSYNECSSCESSYALFSSNYSSDMCFQCKEDDASKCCVLAEDSRGGQLKYTTLSTECSSGSILFGHACIEYSSAYKCEAFTSYGRCKTCMSGYYLGPNSNCLACMDNCAECYGPKSCSQCSENYFFLDVTNAMTSDEMTTAKASPFVCYQCGANCLCNGVVTKNVRSDCDECITGYYLSGSQCVACNATCATCNSKTVCLSCRTDLSSTYVLSGGYCLQCPDNCRSCTYNSSSSYTTCTTDGCENGYYLDDESEEGRNVCSPCDVSGYQGRCKKSSSAILPTYCAYNRNVDPQEDDRGKVENLIFLSTDDDGAAACFTNEANCKSVLKKITFELYTNKQYCTECYQNYVLTSSNTCVNCITSLDNCYQCSSTTACDICDSGYYLDSSSLCQACVTNCSACQLNKVSGNITCSTCVSGYYAYNTTNCFVCSVDHCATCTSEKCISCLSTYALNGTVCSSCYLSQCLNCTFTQDKPYCTSCSTSYYLHNGECYAKSSTSCIEFDSTNQKCIACASGTRLVDGKCLIGIDVEDLGLPYYINLQTCLLYTSPSPRDQA
eukprot:TRINITY_DN269_c0_g1_i1.p1 TRINITY_DN269_c0_g1~~TRINITY_DN269_c0_g1_i1.p1  ORF type:complete len:638 (-),score=99.30 TRINITY_DN269_c0_g1_i1:108-2021(-)